MQDPELRRDLVTLGMVKDVAVEGGAVRLTVELTTPACPLKDTIAKDVTAALTAAGPPASSSRGARRCGARPAPRRRSSSPA